MLPKKRKVTKESIPRLSFEYLISVMADGLTDQLTVMKDHVMVERLMIDGW